MNGLLAEAFDLHHLWQHDPAAAVGHRPRLSALFESHRRRHRRFGEMFVRLVLRTGEPDRAREILYDYIDRYGVDEAFEDLDSRIRASMSQATRGRNGDLGTAVLEGLSTDSDALLELLGRAEASAGKAFSEVAISAQNLDRIHTYVIDHVAMDFEARISSTVVEGGGAGATTAFALACLGNKAATAGILADDADGDVLRRSLEEAHVDCQSVITVPGSAQTRTGQALIFVDPYGAQSIYVDAGVNEQLAHVLRSDAAAWGRMVDIARNARLVNFSSFTGDAERHVQEDVIDGLPDDVLVAFDPGSFYSHLGLDRLASFITRCDVLYVYEARLRQLVANSSAEIRQREYSFRDTLEALFRWRAMRVDRPLMVAVSRQGRRAGHADIEVHDMITIAVGRRSVEDLASAHPRGRPEAVVADTTGQGQATAAAVHLGLLNAAPLGEAADLAFVMANEVNSKLGGRAGLPRRSTIEAAWARYFPGSELPAWVPRA